MTGELITVQVKDGWLTTGESSIEGKGATREESIDDYCNQLLLMNPDKGLFKVSHGDNVGVELTGINTIGTSSELDIIFDKARDTSKDVFMPFPRVIEMNIKHDAPIFDHVKEEKDA